ncbi:hypothetical protein [Thermococcus sp. 21S7]|uniref:hypothetical protein n=1 Tax=Thermococcus sp. 21S7 TaxID=1638221 RepID=UPI00143A2734|nr:hypothetical protein [Thermococcus sp. 21S7]NJE62402.1 hypothetical protein [Thermococcus sp. 21S7]
MMPRKFELLAVVLVVTLVLGVGLAVPSVRVGVQEVGAGGCKVRSPVRWATLTLDWDREGWTWTLSGASVVFSDDVPGPFNFTVRFDVVGYHSFWDGFPSTDSVGGAFSTPSSVTAGTPYPLVLNASPSYVVSPFFGIPEPSVSEARGAVLGGLSACPGGIGVLVEGIGMGSTSYSPPPADVPDINVTVDNTGNPELRNYVVNFTVSPSCVPDLGRVYVTDSSGNPLYFWAFNDSPNGKIWFWVNYTVPADSVTEIVVHLNGTGVGEYLNPDRVFWYFSDVDVVLQGTLWGASVRVLPFDVYGFLNAGYPGYAVDTGASLGRVGLDIPAVCPYFLAFTNGNYYGIGVADDGFLYEVSGRFLDGVNGAGNPLGELPSWGPGIYSIAVYGRGGILHTDMYFESEGFLRHPWPSRLGLDFSPYFVLGQKGFLGMDDPSVYDWIGMRPITYPAPKVTVPDDCWTGGGGDYALTLYFRP